MFESSLLRKHGQGFTSIDAGLIAETLLFYGNVHIVGNFSILIDLLKTIGPTTLLRLIDDRIITFTYLRDDFATVTTTQNGLEYHGFIAMHLSGSTTGKRHLNTRESIFLAFERALGKSLATKKHATRFYERIKIENSIVVADRADGIIGLTMEDLDDRTYVREAIKGSLAGPVPSFRPRGDFDFGVMKTDGGLLIHHNIDMKDLNSKFKQAYPDSNATLNSALLLNQLVEARAELQLSANYMAELVSSPATASIVRARLAIIMQKRDRNVTELEMF
jgi:hypothetical protein